MYTERGLTHATERRLVTGARRPHERDDAQLAPQSIWSVAATCSAEPIPAAPSLLATATRSGEAHMRLAMPPLRSAFPLFLAMALCAAQAALARGDGDRDDHRHAKPGCKLANGIQHVVHITFDNVHFNRDNPNVPSDL